MGYNPHRPTDLHGLDRVVAFDIETIVDEEPADGSFPPWPQHKPVAAAFLSADWAAEGYAFDLTTLTCASGEEARFYAEVDALLPKGPVGVTYNGAGFDLPVLRISAMAAHQLQLSGLANQAGHRRYGDQHADLAELFSGYGATRRVPLAELCARLQIPVKTTVHGSEVGALWRAGEIDQIRQYVEEDVVATYILWLYWSSFRAGDERRITLPLADLVGWIERTPTLAHLRHFCTCFPAMWARPRALFHRTAQARADAELRRQHARDRRAFAGEPAIF